MIDYGRPETYTNKIIWGDCLEVMKRMPDKSVDLVVTDPPYGMNYISNHRKYANKVAVPINGDKIFDHDFHCAMVFELHRLLADNSHLYVFCNDLCYDKFKTIYEKYFNVKRMLIWEKDNWSAGDLEEDYGVKTEFILYASNGRKPLRGEL